MDQPHLHVVFASPPSEELMLTLTGKGFVVRRTMDGTFEGYGHGDRAEIAALVAPAGGKIAGE